MSAQQKAAKRSNVIAFEGLGPCYYILGDFRPPRKGEFFLSGARVQGHLAYNDMTTPYRIARPTTYAMDLNGHKAGEAVTF